MCEYLLYGYSVAEVCVPWVLGPLGEKAGLLSGNLD